MKDPWAKPGAAHVLSRMNLTAELAGLLTIRSLLRMKADEAAVVERRIEALRRVLFGPSRGER